MKTSKRTADIGATWRELQEHLDLERQRIEKRFQEEEDLRKRHLDRAIEEQAEIRKREVEMLAVSSRRETERLRSALEATTEALGDAQVARKALETQVASLTSDVARRGEEAERLAFSRDTLHKQVAKLEQELASLRNGRSGKKTRTRGRSRKA